MTDKIWYKMLDLKYGEVYLSNYLGLQYTLKKISKVLTLALSASGLLGWKYFENYTWVAFLLIAVLQILSMIDIGVVRSDKEIEEIAALRMMYTKYFNKLEKLWSSYRQNQINEIQAVDEFFDLQSNHWMKIAEVDCKMNIKEYRKLIKKTDIQTREYINKYLQS